MDKVPEELFRNSNSIHLTFSELYIIPGPNSKIRTVPLRQIRAAHIGTLVSMRGIVTRSSNIKPCISVATFACEVCGYEAYQTVPSKTFQPQYECPSPICRTNQTKGNLFMQIRYYNSFMTIEDPSL